MYAKLENNHLVYPPHEYVEDGYVYCPPRAEQIVAMGFKPVVDNKPEGELPQGHWWRAVYSDGDACVTIDYRAQELEMNSAIGE